MKLANIQGRAHLVSEAGGCDINTASAGKFSADLDELIPVLNDLKTWATNEKPTLDASLSTTALATDLSQLDAPIQRPSQIFAIGLNYQAHADEGGLEVPKEPMVFTKFASSLAGPGADVPVVSGTVDWEVELVAVIGKPGRNISEGDALSHVAAYCVGQDISNREKQFVSQPAQFSLAKSHLAFSPIGPWLTTADEVDPNNLKISCGNEEQVLQDGHTSLMMFNTAQIIAYLSTFCELRTGDLIFTGTPDGVGIGRQPPLFVQEGWTVTSTIEKLGELKNTFVKA